MSAPPVVSGHTGTRVPSQPTRPWAPDDARVPDMPGLFSSYRMRGLTLRNRLVFSPRCQFNARDGLLSRQHVSLYGERLLGQLGLCMVEPTAIEPAGRRSHGCLGLWNDVQRRAYTPLIEMAHALDTCIGISLNHAGRRAGDHTLQEHSDPSTNPAWTPLAPTALAHDSGACLPIAMTSDDIAHVIDGFAQAAGRAVQAGFDLIEVHASHGYLLHQFLSPLSNRRHDDWGGSFANRTRLLLAVVDAVRASIPATMPVLVRLVCSDQAAGGWTFEDASRLATQLATRGVDAIDCASGGLVPPSARKPAVAFNAEWARCLQPLLTAHGVTPPTGPARSPAQASTASYPPVDWARWLRTNTGLAVGIMGRIADAHSAHRWVQEGRADLVFVGRALVDDPSWGLRAAQSLERSAPAVSASR